MVFLKKVLVGVGVLMVGVVLIGFLLPKDYRVERSILIEAKPEEVYPDIVDLRAWVNWGVWFQRDPNMILKYSGSDRAIGMFSSWESETEGNGEMEITQLEHNKKVVYRLYFPEVGMGSTGSLILTPVGDATRVTWHDSGEVGINPVDRYFILIIDSVIGPDFATGLENLKTIIENRG